MPHLIVIGCVSVGPSIEPHDAESRKVPSIVMVAIAERGSKTAPLESLQISAVETIASYHHHGDTIKGSPFNPLNITAILYRGTQKGSSISPPLCR